MSARTADKVEATIKNFGKKVADRKFKKNNQVNVGSGSSTASEPSRGGGVSLKSSNQNSDQLPKKKEGCC